MQTFGSPSSSSSPNNASKGRVRLHERTLAVNTDRGGKSSPTVRIFLGHLGADRQIGRAPAIGESDDADAIAIHEIEFGQMVQRLVRVADPDVEVNGQERREVSGAGSAQFGYAALTPAIDHERNVTSSDRLFDPAVHMLRVGIDRTASVQDQDRWERAVAFGFEDSHARGAREKTEFVCFFWKGQAANGIDQRAFTVGDEAAMFVLFGGGDNAHVCGFAGMCPDRERKAECEAERGRLHEDLRERSYSSTKDSTGYRRPREASDDRSASRLDSRAMPCISSPEQGHILLG